MNLKDNGMDMLSIAMSGKAAASAAAAAASAEDAAGSAEEAAGYAAEAFSGTPEGYAELVQDVTDLNSAVTYQTDSEASYIKISKPPKSYTLKTGFSNKTTLRLLLSKGNMLSLPFAHDSGYTVNGVEFTINDDYSITARGLATADIAYDVVTYTNPLNVKFHDGRYGYYLSGCDDGSDSTYYIWHVAYGYKCTTKPVLIASANGVPARVAIVIKAGVSIDKTFYVMQAPEYEATYTKPYESITANVSSTDTEHTWTDIDWLEGENYIFTQNGASIDLSANMLIDGGEINSKVNILYNEIFEPYYYVGNNIDFRKHGYNIDFLHSVPQNPQGTVGPQGFTIFKNVLFQLYRDDSIVLIDLATGNVINNFSIDSDHGDTIDFSNDYYQANDEFPIAYITADSTPAKIYVNRITRQNSTLLKTLYFGDISKTGYYAGHCGDYKHNKLYLVGYKEDSYLDDDEGNNKIIVSLWNLANQTQNDDDTYTPEFIKSFELPFITTVQGQMYFDDKIFLLSSAPSNPNTKIYVVDPTREDITAVFDSFPHYISASECEAIGILDQSNRYDMVISNATAYYIMTFGA